MTVQHGRRAKREGATMPVQKRKVAKTHREKNGAPKQGNHATAAQRRPSKMNGASPPSIGDYLIRRLQDYGIRDVFGIPGDFVLQFYAMLQESPIRVVGARREDCAGYAADGYARVNGMGA